MTLRLSLRIDAEAAQARSEIGETGAAINAVAQEARDLGEAAKVGAQGTNILGTASGAAASEVAAITQGVNAAAREALALGASSQAGSQGMQEMAAAAGVSSTALQEQINALTGVGAAQRSAAESAQAFRSAFAAADEYTALRAAIDPVHAASMRLAAAQKTVSRAIETGAISAAEGAATLGRYEAAVEAAAAAEMRRTGTIGAMGAANRGAAGSMSNLIAQFNDIGVMMAAGQNPLQLALQQGTQVSQVIGPMGAAGAVRALGGAFVGMLNPVSIATIATIGLGAAAVQWFTRAGAAVITVDDAVSGLGSSIDALREASDTSTDDLRESFAGVTPEVLQLQRELLNIRIRETMLDAAAATRSLGDAVDAMGGLFATGTMRLGDLFQMNIGQASQLEQQLLNVGRATTFEGQIAALDRAQATMIAQVGSIDQMTEGQLRFYAQTVEVERVLREAAAATGEAVDASRQVPGGIAAAADEARRLASELAAAVGQMDALSSAGQSALRVAQIRLANVGDPVGTERELRRARAQEAAAGLLGSEDAALRIAGQQFVEQEAAIGEAIAQTIEQLRTRETALRGAAQGAGASSDAVRDLIAGLQDELAVMRETDPVRQEMLRHREALAGATAAERAEVESLISARQSEAAAMQAAQERAQFFGQMTATALEGLIVRGESFEDVLKNIGAALAQAAIQAAIFGSGPFGNLFGGRGLFGGGGGGGFLGFLGLGVQKADGGMIYGEGGPREDKVPALLSPGEFVVNAAATSRNRAMLEAINSGGAVPRFAQGGMVGGGMGAGGAGTTAAPVITQNFDLRGVAGDAEIRRIARVAAREGLREYDRLQAPRTARRIKGDPRVIG